MTIDLTKITTPFGLLDVEDQDALRDAYAAGATLEFFSMEGVWEDALHLWAKHVTYRVQPAPLRDINIPWDMMAPNWIAAARDKDGSVRIFDRVPMLKNEDWDCAGPMGVQINRIIKIDPGNKPWDQSLVMRPGYAEKKD